MAPILLTSDSPLSLNCRINAQRAPKNPKETIVGQELDERESERERKREVNYDPASAQNARLSTVFVSPPTGIYTDAWMEKICVNLLPSIGRFA